MVLYAHNGSTFAMASRSVDCANTRRYVVLANWQLGLTSGLPRYWKSRTSNLSRTPLIFSIRRSCASWSSYFFFVAYPVALRRSSHCHPAL